MNSTEVTCKGQTHCAYCGAVADVLTRDHVIPKALWGGKGWLPNWAVTVPACHPCQKYWDAEAEYFRNIVVAMIDRGRHPVSDRLLEGPVTRSLERSRKARRDFFRNVHPVEQRNQSGIILGYRLAFEMDVSRFSRSIEKIVRGLFFCKSHYALPSGYRVIVVRGNDFWADNGFQNLLAAMEPTVGCRDNVFVMRCARDCSDPNITAWLIQFYGAIAVLAWTEVDAPLPQAVTSASINSG